MLKTNKEFKEGQHGIGWLDPDFIKAFKGTEFKKKASSGHFQTLARRMTDAEIERELRPGMCELGDVLAFLDGASKECKDGYANIFYLPSAVVRVYWDGDEWYVDAWQRDGDEWREGCRVFSPATGPSDTLVLSDSVTLGSLLQRIEALEVWKKRMQEI